MHQFQLAVKPDKRRWLARGTQIAALLCVLGPFIFEMLSFFQGRKILRAMDPVFIVPFSKSVGLLVCVEAVVIFCLIGFKARIKSFSLVALGTALAGYNILFHYYGGPKTICPCFGSFFDAMPILANHRELVKILYISLLFVLARILIATEPMATANPLAANSMEPKR